MKEAKNTKADNLLGDIRFNKFIDRNRLTEWTFVIHLFYTFKLAIVHSFMSL